MQDDVTRRAFLRLLGFGSVALALSACQQAAQPPAPAGATAAAKTGAASAPQATEPLTLPIVTQPLTLTYWAPMSKYSTLKERPTPNGSLTSTFAL